MSKRDDDLIDKFIKFLADIGRGLERNCSDKVIAIILIIVAWTLHPIGALIATLLIANIYFAKKPITEREEGAEDEKVESRYDEIAVTIGLILIVIGSFWFIREYIWIVPWSAILVIIGILLTLYGLSKR
ncbi:MAG: hypothetical protein KAU16_08585 [Methanophagales archaeon]|nr:hypothetical protein [Methanophagales archaeon]